MRTKLIVAGLAFILMSATSGPVGAATIAVSIVDFNFQPSSVTVSSGGSVKWTQNGADVHTVTADDGSFDSDTILSGQTYTQTFSGPARTVRYYCKFHGAPGGIGMSGTVVVGGSHKTPYDFDGDGKTDEAVFRPSASVWYVHGSAGADTVANFGTSGDVPVPGDYDGNATTDIAVFRPSTGTWFVRGGTTVNFGTSGDNPVPGDYDGNVTTDMAVFRPSTGKWLVRGGVTVGWGGSGDVALPLPDAIRRFFFPPL